MNRSENPAVRRIDAAVCGVAKLGHLLSRLLPSLGTEDLSPKQWAALVRDLDAFAAGYALAASYARSRIGKADQTCEAKSG